MTVCDEDLLVNDDATTSRHDLIAALRRHNEDARGRRLEHGFWAKLSAPR
jgi:hypothetical protein